MIAPLLAVAIQLFGVTGDGLRARAFFDVNNVKVGDPLVLTIDFIGAADFHNLHPPALSRSVNRKDWKVDDASAKTDTYNAARRLTYRVRPLREGVLWFPALEFAYEDANGALRTVRANEIPVHAKAGEQVEVTDAMKQAIAEDELPRLTLVAEAPDELSEDLLFAWKKALATPSADAFAAFDFPAAKLNEATCAINDGNWARAMKVYASLEWQIGQTPEIERGITAALALKTDNTAAELPVWRQVLRPVLRLDWRGRLALVLGVLGGLFLVGWLLGRGIRAIAALGFALLLVLPTAAETIETVTTNADGSVTTTQIIRQGGMTFQTSRTTGGTGGIHGGTDPFAMMDDFDPFMRRRAARPKVEVGVKLSSVKPAVSIGESFELILAIEHPQAVALSGSPRVVLGERDFFQFEGSGGVLPPIPSPNPTNIINRFSFTLRPIVSYAGPLHYSVGGSYVFQADHPIFRTSYPFESGVHTTPLEIRPFPATNRPPDFSGIAAHNLRLTETCDLCKVETNDVVTITYRLKVGDGFVPETYLPENAAFEWMRHIDANGRLEWIEYRRYFVADGAPKTPPLSISFYHPQSKTYRTVTSTPTKLEYFSPLR